MVIFLLSITILTSRSSIITTIIGWEFLGISSLILIIFYPNKTGKINSVITIIFNRIGDVILIAVIRIMLVNINSIINIRTKLESTKWIVVIIIVCAITKRAQFPITAWLPAAISAPTPISAIVHSSTLVTAGIFVIIKMNNLIERRNLIQIITSRRILTFLLGGLIANREKDYKKIIAFSTIRQVRLIITIRTIQLVNLRIIHIINHALFKTLLFCSSGIRFISELRNQDKIKIEELKRNKIIKLITIIRVFRITGLIASSSFYTKDLILEKIYTEETSRIIILIITARILTLLYCCKLIKRTISNFQRTRKKIRKNFKIIYLRTFIVITVAVIIIPRRKRIFWKNRRPLSTGEVITIIVTLTVPLIVETKIKWISKLTKSVRIIKLAMHRYWKNRIERITIKETTFREIITLKRFILKKTFKMEIQSPFIITRLMIIIKLLL